MYQVVLGGKAKRNLKKIDRQDRPRLLAALVGLRKEPYLGKKLSGKYQDGYSLRVWPYRIIYKIYKKQLLVLVINIGHRGGVY